MEIHESREDEILTGACQDWLERKCGSEVQSFPLYDRATEMIGERVTPQIYEEFCNSLQGDLRYENRILENQYRLYSVNGQDVYVYYSAAEQQMRVICVEKMPEDLLTKPVWNGEPICEPVFDVLNMHYELQCGQNNGLGLVFILEDGSFLIYDGGFKEEDGERLFQYLKERNQRSDGILITAWILTHGHEDHYGAFLWLTKKYGSLVRVRYFLFNPVLNCREGTDYLCSVANTVAVAYPAAERVVPHTGMKFRFCGLTLEILFTHEDILPLPVTCFNDSSTVTKVTFSNGVQCLIMGDMQSRSRISLLQNVMGEYLKSDILQVPHHGDSGGTEVLYELIDPSVVIYSTSNEKFERISQKDWSLAPNAFLLNELHVKHVIIADERVQTVFGEHRFGQTE